MPPYKRLLLICVVLGAPSLVLFGSLTCTAWRAGAEATSEFKNLLRGSTQSNITALVIQVGDEQFSITDPESTQYLTAAFHSATQHDIELGPTYRAVVCVDSGKLFECAIHVPSTPGAITLFYPLDAWDSTPDMYYRVNLPEPIPSPLATVITRLRVDSGQSPTPHRR
jgi:hypothetical protein